MSSFTYVSLSTMSFSCSVLIHRSWSPWCSVIMVDYSVFIMICPVLPSSRPNYISTSTYAALPCLLCPPLVLYWFVDPGRYDVPLLQLITRVLSWFVLCYHPRVLTTKLRLPMPRYLVYYVLLLSCIDLWILVAMMTRYYSWLLGLYHDLSLQTSRAHGKLSVGFPELGYFRGKSFPII